MKDGYDGCGVLIKIDHVVTGDGMNVDQRLLPD